MSNLCIFCRKSSKSEICKKATDKGYSTFRESVKSRKEKFDFKFGSFLEEYDNVKFEDVQYHRSCYSNFTNKTLISRLRSREQNDKEPDQCDEETATKPRTPTLSVRRSSTASSSSCFRVTDWSMCIICQECKKGRDHLRKVNITSAQKIESLAEIDNSLFTRIKDVNLEVVQAVHHGLCLIDLERQYNQKAAKEPKKKKAFKDLCDELRVQNDKVNNSPRRSPEFRGRAFMTST